MSVDKLLAGFGDRLYETSTSNQELREVKQPTNDYAALLGQELLSLNKSSDISTSIGVKSGKALFTQSDVEQTYSPVAKLLRMIFVDRDITTGEFAELHRTSCHPDLTNTDINTAKCNYIKTMMKDGPGNKLTFTKLQEIVNVIGLDMLNVEITLRDRKTGDIKSYSINRGVEFPTHDEQLSLPSAQLAIEEHSNKQGTFYDEDGIYTI